MRILTEYLMMNGVTPTGGGPPPPGSTPPPDGGPSTGEGGSTTGDAGAKPGAGEPPPAGTPSADDGIAMDGALSEGEVFEMAMEEGVDVRNLSTTERQQLLDLGRQANLRTMERGTADRGVRETADHHRHESTESRDAHRTEYREYEVRSSFRESLHAAQESGDFRTLSEAWKRFEKSGAGTMAGSGDRAGTGTADTRPRDPATPKPGTTAHPGTGKPSTTATPTRPVINLANLTPQQRTMVERFMALRNEARQLRQQAEGMPEGPEKRALLLQAEAVSEEGNGLQAMLAADGIPMTEDAEVREEGEAGSGEGGTTGEGEGVGGLRSDEVVTRTRGRDGEGGGSGGEGSDARGEEPPRLPTAEVGSRLYFGIGTGDDRSTRASGERVLLGNMVRGCHVYATRDAVRMYSDGGEDEGGSGDRGRRGSDSNPLDASPIESMPGWARGNAPGGLGEGAIHGPDGRIYNRWELVAARDIRLGRRDASEETPRMGPLMRLPVAQLDELLYGDVSRPGGLGSSGSMGSMGSGPRFETLTARCLAISARSDESRYRSSNPGHYDRAWFA